MVPVLGHYNLKQNISRDGNSYIRGKVNIICGVPQVSQAVNVVGEKRQFNRKKNLFDSVFPKQKSCKMLFKKMKQCFSCTIIFGNTV